MNLADTPLFNNNFLADFDVINNWRTVTPRALTCFVCHKKIHQTACFTQLGAECLDCVVANIKNCVEAEKIANYALPDLRKAMSSSNGLRWRFLFLYRFKEIYEQEKTPNRFSLEVQLIEQLGYVTRHPLSQMVRQAAYDTCLELGNNILPLLTKLYRQNPWQFNINIVQLACAINPAYEKVHYMAEIASTNSNVEVRLRVVSALKAVDKNSNPWAKEILHKLCHDPDQNVKKLAREYVNYQSPVDKKDADLALPSPPAKSISTKDKFRWYQHFNENKTALHYKCEDIIARNYSAAILKKLASLHLIPIIKKQNSIEPDISIIDKLKKSHLITIFAHILLDKELLQSLLTRLPKTVKNLFETLVWEGSTRSVQHLEKELKIQILSSPKGGFNFASEIVHPDFLIFQHQIKFDYFAERRNGIVFINKELSDILKKQLPLPEIAILKSANKLPKKFFTYADDNRFVHQVDLFLEYLRQGNIQFAKTTGKLLKTSLKKWQQFFHIREFYPDEDDTELAAVFSHLLISFLKKIAEQKTILKQIQDVKKLLLDYFNNKNVNSFSYFYLLPHISNYHYLTTHIERAMRESFFNLLNEMKNYAWLSLNNLAANFSCHGDLFYSYYRQEMMNAVYVNFPINNDYYYSAYARPRLSEDMYRDVFLDPLIKAAFFLYAAIGLVDIAYDYPNNAKYQLSHKKYLSIYDGLKYVRLNDFGKYVLGVAQDYHYQTDDKPTKVVLDDKRLMITIEGSGRLERMVLNRVANKIGENYYKISYQSFLKNCFTKEDVANHIALFKEKISSDLSPIWMDFFKELEDKTNPLTYRGNIYVFKIKPGKQLISLIATDEILKKNILKVEDYHIAIENHNVNKVKKRLREFGFFIDNI